MIMRVDLPGAASIGHEHEQRMTLEALALESLGASVLGSKSAPTMSAQPTRATRSRRSSNPQAAEDAASMADLEKGNRAAVDGVGGMAATSFRQDWSWDQSGPLRRAPSAPPRFRPPPAPAALAPP